MSSYFRCVMDRRRMEEKRNIWSTGQRESAHLHHTPGAMSTSVKQERTICVLLPNKDQLDITVGVSAYSNMALLPWPSSSHISPLLQSFCWLWILLFLHLLQPKSTGQDVFNRVEELLGIKELHFFGLTVVKGKFTVYWPVMLFNQDKRVTLIIESLLMICVN